MIHDLDLGDLDKWAEQPKLAGSVRAMADLADDIIATLEHDPSVTGDTLPWFPTHSRFRLRPGELTLWAGPKGTWKSFVLNHVLLDVAVAQRKRVLLCSLEFPARIVGARIMQQAFAGVTPNAAGVRKFLESTRTTLGIVDAYGRMSPRDAVALVRWAAIERQVKHVALDNLTKIVSVSTDAAAEQQSFANDLQSVALETGCHVHAAAHTRKPGATGNKLEADEIRGSGSIADQADNVVMFWRNRAKEQAQEDGKMTDELRAEPDLVLRLAHQRNGRYEGNFRFWKHANSMQFLTDGLSDPITYAT